MTDHYAAIRNHIAAPTHIRAIADACLYDLMHGPSWLRVPQGDVTLIDDDCVAALRADLEDDAECGDVIEETYCGTAADALRDFLCALPSEVWVDADCGFVMEREPDQYEEIEVEEEDEDTGEMVTTTQMIECDWSRIRHVEHREIVAALFGKTFAREFN